MSEVRAPLDRLPVPEVREMWSNPVVMDFGWERRFETLLTQPSPAVLTTYRKSGSAASSPVWFRYHDGSVEVVIAESDVKIRHLAHRPEASVVVFETVRPFRGIEVSGTPELVRGDVTAERTAIASRYLGQESGARFAAGRVGPAVLLRLDAQSAKTWDLTAILPQE